RAIAPVHGERLRERGLERRGLGEKSRKGSAEQRVGAGGEQILGCGVGIAADVARVERNHGGGEELETRVRSGGHREGSNPWPVLTCLSARDCRALDWARRRCSRGLRLRPGKGAGARALARSSFRRRSGSLP